MFKALIVDDERLDREGLKGQIDWERYGITRLETAKNGFEAFEIIKDMRPDILVTDVKMPGMSGLELAQRASEEVPFIKIIFISGFDDFEFVKNALMINAYEYILKPVDTDELEAAIRNVINSRLKEKKADEESLQLMNRVNESKPLFKKKFLMDLIYGAVDEKEAKKNISYLQLNLGRGLCRALLCEIDDFRSLSEELDANGLEDLHTRMAAVIRTLSQDVCTVEFEQIEPSRYVLLLDFGDSTDMDRINRATDELSRQLLDKVRSNMSLSLTIGMGGISKSITDISSSYDNCCRALSQKMLRGKGKVLEYFPATNIKGPDVDVHNTANELVKCIKTLDLNKAFHLADHLFDSLEAGSIYDGKYIQNFCINIISRVEIVLFEMNEKLENIFDSNVVLWEKLMKFETILDMRQWMKNVFRAVIEYFENKNARKNRKIISEIEKYIEGNYSRELTLKDIAAEFYYSPNYLGSMFKEELGVGFFEYLTEFRMKKAAELLKLSRMKIYEVAYQVGYKSTPSFINQFKLSYNMTPAEYRERF